MRRKALDALVAQKERRAYDTLAEQLRTATAGQVSLAEAAAVGEAMARLEPERSRKLFAEWVRPPGLLGRLTSVPLWWRWAAVAGLAVLGGPDANGARRVAGRQGERRAAAALPGRPRTAGCARGRPAMTDNIMQAQEQIAVTLARARSEEDRELLNRVRDVGGQVVHIFHGLLRMARIHAPNNTAFDGPVRDFENGLSNLIDLLGPAYILCAEDQVFLNDVRIRFEFVVDESSPLISDLMRHNAGGITFNEPLTGPEIRNLVQLIAGTPGGRQPRTTLQLRLAARGPQLGPAPPSFPLPDERERGRRPALPRSSGSCTCRRPGRSPTSLPPWAPAASPTPCRSGAWSTR